MKARQHRCPYYLLKISKTELDEFISHKKQEQNEIKYYQSQINALSEKIKVYESAIHNIFNTIKPIYNFAEPIPLIECVEKAYLSPITKSNTLVLVNKYIEFCNNKMNSKVVENKGDIPLEEIPSIYEPDMAYEFITTKKPPYNRSTIKKHLNTLLRLLKISTKNPFLTYTLPLGNCESTKLKHLLTIDEIKSFIKYLNQTKHYIAILIVMLLYKFGLRIGSISKLKCLDLDKNNQIIFKEKNNIIIRRLLLNETSLVIQRLINECNLKKEDYLFYDFKFKGDDYKRALYFSKKIRNLMISSNSFSNNKIETISSHSFRVLHAVESYKAGAIEEAKKELGHKNVSTTYNSYLRPELRNLNFKEEKFSFLMNKGEVVDKINSNNIFIKNQLFKKKSRFKEKNIEQDFSSDSEEEGEDIIDDDFHIKNDLFYFEGHFNEDIDFKQNITLTKNTKFKEININEFEDNSLNDYDDITETNRKQVKKINAKYANFLFNNTLNEKTLKKNKDTLKIIANNEDFNYSLEIFSEKNDAIDAKKVKNKKECFSLSENDSIILQKTIALNKKGIFYNIKADNKDGKVYLMATENIPDNTLLTIVGGKIYYNYQYIKDKIDMPDKMSPIIPYFETANRAYDRIISVCPLSIVRFLFTSLSDGEGNLQLKKIIDSEENILLCVLTNGLIKKGDILSLNNEILLNPDLVL